MSRLICFLIFLASAQFAIADNDYIDVVSDRPDDFVNLQQIIPQVQVDMRYSGSYNFVGKPINGYNAPVCLLTKKAAYALKLVEDKLLPRGLTLKVYDCYRPQRAVDNFVSWAESIHETKMKQAFYPSVDKKNLFQENYIAYQSGHSRGSTVDLTIVPLNSKIPLYPTKFNLSNCNLNINKRPRDNSLDFGTGFDCFSLASHPDYTGINSQAKANRLLLRTLMVNAGFRGLDSEWWHFTLQNEPYTDKFFDFPIEP